MSALLQIFGQYQTLQYFPDTRVALSFLLKLTCLFYSASLSLQKDGSL